MMKYKMYIFIFHRDLRIYDQNALQECLNQAKKIMKKY